MPRPREFDPDEVVEKAMHVFWRKGYLGTSLQDLVDETGVNRASLYATFDDKHSLFLRSLAHYRRAVVPGRTEILETPGSGLERIREYFDAVADDLVGPACGRGCLMVNSATELAPHDPEVADQVSAHFGRLEKAFATALERAAERGEIADPSGVRRYARFLTGAAQGLIVVGKASPDRAMLADIINATLHALR